MADDVAQEVFTIDDVIALLESEPTKWKPALYCYAPWVNPAGVPTSTPGTSLSPISNVTPPVDSEWLWSQMAMRLDAPGKLIVRLMPSVGQEKSRSCVVDVNAANFTRFRGPIARPSAAAPQAPQAIVMAPGPPPPTDLMGVMATMMTTILTKLLERDDSKSNPIVTQLMDQNRRLEDRLTAAMKEPRTVEKEERESIFKLAKDAAEAGGGGLTAFAPALERAAAVVEKGLEHRAETERHAQEQDNERLKLEIKLLETQIAAHEKGMVLVRADDAAPTVNGHTPNAAAAASEVEKAKTATA